MKMITLGELLTEKQVPKVLKIVKESKSADDCISKLNKYFNTIGKYLTKRGVVPEYLALAVTASFVLPALMSKAKPTAPKKGKK